jgi:hypothetical protein
MSVQPDNFAHAAGIEAALAYLTPSSRVNRRYVAPGAELNTGSYRQHRVLIRNARPFQDVLNLNHHGFMLARWPSAVADFRNKADVDAVYPREVERAVKDLTGADVVLPLGYMLRSAGTTGGGVQPPASDVHVDMSTDRAGRLASAIYAKHFPGRAKFKRFIASSLWRPVSKPPHDWPLAVCDGSSVDPNEGVPNIMVIVDVLPDPNAIPADLPGADKMPAASVFYFNAAHRWWYFPEMTRDEILLVKLHDSDHSKAWRAPHTSFRDPSVTNGVPRESIEFRTIAYFL